MALFAKTIEDAKAALTKGNLSSAMKILTAHIETEHNVQSDMGILIRQLANFQHEILMAQHFASQQKASDAINSINNAEGALVKIKYFIRNVNAKLNKEK